MFRFHTIIILIVVFPARTLYTSCSTLPEAASPFENQEISVNTPSLRQPIKNARRRRTILTKHLFVRRASQNRSCKTPKRSFQPQSDARRVAELLLYTLWSFLWPGLPCWGFFRGGGGGLTSLFSSPPPNASLRVENFPHRCLGLLDATLLK